MALDTKVNKQVKSDVQDTKKATLELEKLFKIEYIPNLNIKKYNDEQLIQLILVAGCVGFGAVSYDVFSESSFHLFAPIDAAVHGWVNSDCSEQMKSFADHVISNIPIAIGTIGCTYSATRMLLKGDKSDIQKLAFLLPFFVLGFGYFDGQFRAGGVAANTFKVIFHRTRPSEYLHSFSYPSGHSATATFMLGIFLIVFLPLISSQDQQNNNNININNKIVKVLNENKYYLWIMGWAVTGSGRLLADVHWFSDVTAGLCLGLVLVATGKLSLLQFERNQESQRQEQLPFKMEVSDTETVKI